MTVMALGGLSEAAGVSNYRQWVGTQREQLVICGMVITPASVFAVQVVVTYATGGGGAVTAQESMPPMSVFRRR